MDEPARQVLQNHRESLHCSCGFDSTVRFMLGEMQHLRAVGKQRRTSLTQVETALVDFRQGGNELRRRRTLALRQHLDGHEQIGVRE